MSEFDWGPVLLGLAAALSGLGVYLQASGKWAAWRLSREQRKADAEEKIVVAEQDRVTKLQAQVDQMVEARLVEQTARITKLEEVNTQHRENIERLTVTVRTLQTENTRQSAALATMEATLIEVNREYDKDRVRWVELQTSLERDIETLRSQLVSVTSDLNRKTAELENLRAEQIATNGQMRQIELTNVRLDEENKGLRVTNGVLASMVERWDTVLPEIGRLLEVVKTQIVVDPREIRGDSGAR